MNRPASRGIATIVALCLPLTAHALIVGGTGNKPLSDPGWTRGVAPLFNHQGRIAWWEGPPFGGGEWHSECRGDARALSTLLAEFARLEAANKRVILHDGAGRSFWIAPNREPEKLADAQIDWMLTAWVGERWQRQRGLPPGLNATNPDDSAPPLQLDIYTARIRWDDVTVPEGLAIVDQRLAAHGFTEADTPVLEGHILDLATNQPLAADVWVETIEPQPSGGYRHTQVARARADASGRWFVKNAPTGWIRVIAMAEGFAPRIAGFARTDSGPPRQVFDTALAHPAPVSGRVVDDAGRPLAEVEVRLDNATAATGGHYEGPAPRSNRTDADGRFQLEGLAGGKGTLWVSKPGYCRPGLGQPVETPAVDIALRMIRAAMVRVTIDFAGAPRPEGYIVSITPEGGEVVGSFGGSGQIDAENRITFERVPPGRYILQGKPNPSDGKDATSPVTVDLVGGKTAEIRLQAR